MSWLSTGSVTLATGSSAVRSGRQKDRRTTSKARDRLSPSPALTVTMPITPSGGVQSVRERCADRLVVVVDLAPEEHEGREADERDQSEEQCVLDERGAPFRVTGSCPQIHGDEVVHDPRSAPHQGS